ncbi:alpha/beta fold hydrolase [Mycobacterium sp.]|uniref:alpha/beta fold hydrolase n=1 Tax=Mycobacterium sp. TaxID=1785 RepID=UPI002DB220B3|nr:alpha/beta fold hydrolase [Mycobacterium sp.]
MPTTHTSFGTVDYTDEGSGLPILLLHATLHDRTDFAPVYDALADGHRVLALDWPGHGASPLSADPLGAVQFGDLLVEFADMLNLRELVVVGNSVGGYAACRLAIESQERVAGLVLVNTGGFTRHSAVTRLVCAVMGKPAVLKAVFPVFVRAYMRAKSPADRAVVARVTARSKTADGARTAAALWKSFTGAGHDLRSRAAQITAPVLITWGARDLTAPLRWGKAVQSAIPGSRFEALPTGHVVFSSEPSDWLDMVLPFVDAAHGVRHRAERHS